MTDKAEAPRRNPSETGGERDKANGASDAALNPERARAGDDDRREAEEYRMLFQNPVFGVFRTTPDGRFLSANDALARILGYDSPDELMSTVKDVAQQVHADPEQRQDFVRQIRERGGVSEFEAEIRKRDGAQGWVSVTARAHLDQAGSLDSFDGILEDITERKLAEMRIAAQNEVSRILGEAPPLADALPGVLEAVCAQLHWQIGEVWLVDKDADVIRCIEYFASGLDAPRFEQQSRSSALQIGKGLPGRVWQSGEATWIDDVTLDSNFPRAASAEEAGLHSAFACPLIVRHEVIGAMEFFTTDRRQADARLHAMATVAGQVGQFIERRNAEEELQRLVFQLDLARQRVTNLVANVPGVVWEVYAQPDPARHRTDFVSDYVENMLGYPASEITDVRRFWLEVIHPEDRERAAREAAATFMTGGHGVSEFRWVAKDGRIIWVETQSNTVHDEDGVPIGMRGVIMDITERRNAEMTVRESEERFSKVFRSSPAGISIVDAAERRFLDVNDAFLEALGYERDEIIGKTVQDVELWPTEDERNRFAQAIAAGQGTARNMEVHLVTKQGEIRSVLGSAEMITLAGRACLLTLMYDISERKASEQRQALLAEAGSALASSLDSEKTLELVARTAVKEFAEVCSVDMVEDGALHRLALAHREPEREEAFTSRPAKFTPARENHPVLRVTRARRAELHRDVNVEELRPSARDERHLEALRSLGLRSTIIVPLVSGGLGLGTMTFARSAASPVFNEEDLAFAEELARRAGLAIDNTLRYQAEREARAEAQALAERQKFLAEASALLASSLDYETTLASLADICVPYLGDWCAIDVVEGGEINRLAVVHRDPAKVEFARKLQERYPPDLKNDFGVRDVIFDGKSIFYPEIPDDLLQAAARDEEHLAIARQMGLRSAISVPLRASGRAFGMLTLVTAESGRLYTAADLGVAEELGHRAGLAVENARLFRESHQVQEELRRANEAKDEFLGLVSHELRTPITTIFGGARLLRVRGDNLDVESRSAVLADIEQESERLHRIVEDLLVLARVELGAEVVTEPVLVQRVIEKTVQGFAKRRPGRTIDVYVVNNLPPVRASTIYLDQILRNLLNNADKYSPAESTVDIYAAHRDDVVEISVQDRGPGIVAEERELIFERFYRSSGTAKQAGGAGIGLTVCKRLVETQGGSIWAEEREGGGLLISFSLPVYTDSGD